MYGLGIGFYRRFVGEHATAKGVVENLPTFIQARPQGSVGRVGLSEERLSCHGLVSALNDRMVGWTALAREAHLHPQRQ
jgi:hypothetical protein